MSDTLSVRSQSLFGIEVMLCETPNPPIIQAAFAGTVYVLAAGETSFLIIFISLEFSILAKVLCMDDSDHCTGPNSYNRACLDD